MSGICGCLGLRRLLVIEEYRVVGRQDRPAAVAENGRNALIGQHLHDHVGAGHLLAGERVPERAGLNDGVVHCALLEEA